MSLAEAQRTQRRKGRKQELGTRFKESEARNLNPVPRIFAFSVLL
jgi:hypothetical protein